VIAIRARRLITCDPSRASSENPLSAIEDGVVALDGGRVVYVGKASAYEGAANYTEASLVTPGLIDAHTHAAWMGSRHGEYVQRLEGVQYTDIAKAGGGIQASQRSIAEASEAEIAETLHARLKRMQRLGVTTVEVKSGYGLLPELELKQLRAIARVRALKNLPRIVPSALLLHAVPASYKDRREDYVRLMCETCVPLVAKEQLAEYVDAYVDAHAFSVSEAEQLCTSARAHALKIRLHIGQFSDIGASALAVKFGADSVDHLEHLSASGARELAAASVHACLLPIASFTLAQAPPDIENLRRAGVRMVVASDANPGTAPSESLPLAMAFAARLYGLRVSEIVLGVTRNAGSSLGLAHESETRGLLTVGARADLVLWNLDHEASLIQPWGTSQVAQIVQDGVFV
jgi:imidazolonepropionase